MLQHAVSVPALIAQDLADLLVHVLAAFRSVDVAGDGPVHGGLTAREAYGQLFLGSERPQRALDDVVRIVNDLAKSGYDGGISIEPHMAAVFHEAGSESEADVMFNTYVEYGRRMERIVKDACA